jgi:putative protease
MKKPELVMPGGDLERVKIAFLYGADAVYVGLDKYSLRKAEVRFSIPEIKEAIEHAHNLGKKLYVTFNIFAHNEHFATIEADMKQIAKFGPDAFIIADPGILNVAKRVAPSVPIHLSTQANTINSESVKFWLSQGVKRVVLGRETTLEDVKQIKKAAPKMELEIFVHGAMCVSYSGRCLLSSALTGRSSNLGQCTQPCRWNYKLKQAPTYFLEEPARPGELMEIQEDEHGTYIMNSKDICLVEYLDDISKAGIDALKVEGRNKTGYYLASVARIYRQGIDLVAVEKLTLKIKKKLRTELEKVTHRPYTTGFLLNEAKKGETFEGRDPIYGNRYLGFVLPNQENESTKIVQVLVKNKIEAGKTYELITPTEIIKTSVKSITDRDNNSLSEANPGRADETVLVEFDQKIPPSSFLRELSK